MNLWKRRSLFHCSVQRSALKLLFLQKHWLAKSVSLWKLSLLSHRTAAWKQPIPAATSEHKWIESIDPFATEQKRCWITQALRVLRSNKSSATAQRVHPTTHDVAFHPWPNIPLQASRRSPPRRHASVRITSTVSIVRVKEFWKTLRVK